jgi:hypothetical protein
LPDPPCFGCPVGIYGKKETLVAAGVPEGSAEQEISGQESAGESNGQADGSAQQGSSSPSGGVVVGITGSVAGDIPGEAPGEDEGPGVEEGPPEPVGPTEGSADCIKRARCPDFVKPPSEEEEEGEEEEGEEEEGEEPSAAGDSGRGQEAGQEEGLKTKGDVLDKGGAPVRNRESNNARQRINDRVMATEKHDKLARDNGLEKDQELLQGKLTYDGKEVRILKYRGQIRIYVPGMEQQMIALNYDKNLWRLLNEHPEFALKYIKKWFQDAGLDPDKLSAENGRTEYVDPETGERYEPTRGGIAKVGTREQRDEAINEYKKKIEELKKTWQDGKAKLKKLSEQREQARQKINEQIAAHNERRAGFNSRIKKAAGNFEAVKTKLGRAFLEYKAGKITEGELDRLYKEEFLPAEIAAKNAIEQLLREREEFDKQGIDRLKKEYKKTFGAVDTEYNQLKDVLDGKEAKKAAEEYSKMVDFKFAREQADAAAKAKADASQGSAKSVELRGESVENQVECQKKKKKII